MADGSPSLASTLTAPQRKVRRHAATLPIVAIFLAAMLVPFIGNDYWVLIASRAAIYWILVSGLNLVVGFAGQLAIGYVALLTLGAYTTSVLVAGNAAPPIHPFAALAIAAVVGAIAGVITGLPALRLRTFYFAMTTLGFATIVTQVALAWQSVTGGGIGLPGPALPAPFDTAGGFYGFCLAVAAFCTWLTSNVAHSRYGRALVAVRDADVAAEAVGIVKSRLLVMIFLFERRDGCAGRRTVRVAADLHHARRLHLRAIGPVLHRDPDRRARIDPRPADRHHRPHSAAGICRPTRGVVDFSLCGAAPGCRPRGAGRHCGIARFRRAASHCWPTARSNRGPNCSARCFPRRRSRPNLRLTAFRSASAACVPSMASI